MEVLVKMFVALITLTLTFSGIALLTYAWNEFDSKNENK